jgi:hypothetical protein
MPGMSFVSGIITHFMIASTFRTALEAGVLQAQFMKW